jgi:hypothetical protein
VDVRSIVEGEFHENEVRKDFTPSERVAIERTINAELERRQGARADLGQNLARSEDHRTSKESARLAGFGNRETARQARKVVERGTPELVEAMDRSEIAIGAAADLASEPQEEQRKRLDLPAKKEALKQAKATGAAILARNGKYYGHAEPEREARIGEKIDLDLDAPEELERKADKRTEPKPERKGRKRRDPVPSVAIEDPAQPSALPARDRLKEDLWKVFNAVGRADQLRFIYDACLHHGLDPLRMAPPAAFGLAGGNPELTARLPVEVPQATDDATVAAQAEQRDDVAHPGTEDPQDAGDNLSEAPDQGDLGADELQNDDAVPDATHQVRRAATKCRLYDEGFTPCDPAEMFNGHFYHRKLCLEEVKRIAIAAE